MRYILLARIRDHRLRSEDGFTLIEVLVASGVLLTALLAMAYTTTMALSQVALSRQRQGATGLANRLMEEVRALPFSVLQAGLDNTDLSRSTTAGNASYDPNITTSGCGTGTVYCYGGERIPRGNIATNTTVDLNCSTPKIPPLVPHSCTQTIGVTSYTGRVYVTYYGNNTTSNTFRVTAIVSWPHAQVNGARPSVTVQSVFFSGTGGCVSANTHPFAAPCQPFFYATAGAEQGAVHVGGTIGTSELDANDPPSLELPLYTSDMQVEQITAVTGVSQTASAAGTLLGSDQQSIPAVNITSGADNDPAQPGNEFGSATNSLGPTGGPLTFTGDTGTLTLSTSGIDTLATNSTTSATSSHPCANLSGTNQTDSQPCGNSNVTEGSTLTAALAFSKDGITVPSATLVSLAHPSSADVAYTKRKVAGGVSTCVNTSGDGCIHAESQRFLGTISFGGLPSGLSGGTGWTGYLITITSYTDHVTAEAGVSAASPTATHSGTLSYWNGSGYTTCTIGTNCPATITTAAVSAQTSSGVHFSIPSATLTVGATALDSLTGNCASPCTVHSAVSASPLSGNMSYQVTGPDTSSWADLTINVALGQLDAKATYKPVTAS